MIKLHQIKASAGSGKTYALTKCFLDALGDCGRKGYSFRPTGCAISGQGFGNSFGSLLAITFTNAAATEMRERILSRLKDAALGRDTESGIDQAEAAKWLDILLQDMDNLNIRTIDSLLHQIARAAALDLGLHPDFEPVFDSRDALAPFLEIFFRQAADEGSRERRELQNACMAVMEYSDNKSFTAGQDFDKIIFKFVDAILENRFPDLEPAANVRAKYETLKANAVSAAQEFFRLGEALNSECWKVKPKAYLLEIAQKNIDHCDSKTIQGSSLADFFLKNKFSVSPELEKAFADFHTHIVALAKNHEIFRTFLRYAPFVDMARFLVDAFRANMSLENCCPSILVPALAKEALESPNGVSDAICRLGNRLAHFMIDEFQDTSRGQWEAIRPLVEDALARAGSLTWVGDVKQSIYGWRNGDPSLFDDILEDVGTSCAEDERMLESLGHNWRSLPEIIHFNNRLFQPLAEESFAGALLELFLKEAPQEIRERATKRIALAFADTTQKPAEKTPKNGGHVSVMGSDGDLEENLADLVEKIARRRPLEDILILCRSGANAALAAEALLGRGIPIITENSLRLADHPLICQAVALLAFLDNQADEIAFWTFINGSIVLDHPRACALDAQKLAEWGAAPRGTGLVQAFREQFPEEWKSLVAPFDSLARLLTPYDMVMEFFRVFDVDRRFPDDRTFLRRFMEILHLAENAGQNSLADFLTFWRDRGCEEKAPMPEKMHAVSIMTIHKAKGLQAKVAIVPWTDFGVHYHSMDPLLVNHDGMRLVIPTRKCGGAPYYQSLANQVAENLDLLYVAFTRACEELYIFCPPQEGRGAEKSLVLNLLAKADIDIPASFGELPQGPAIDSDMALPGNDARHTGESPLPDNALAQATAEAMREGESRTVDKAQTGESQSSPEDESTSPLLSWLPDLQIFRKPLDLDVFRQNDRGSFLHFCLENMQPADSDEEMAQNALAHGLAFGGIEVPEAERENLMESLAWFASLPQSRHWLEDGRPEQSIMDASGKLMRVDNLVREAFGTLILDYKSGNFADEHVAQMQNYLRCIGQIPDYAGKIYGLLIYLDQKAFRLIEADRAHEPTDRLPDELGQRP